MSTARPTEQYTIRRKILKLFGSAFFVYDESGQIAGYCKQKAFKLREDIRIFTSTECTTELVVLKARSIIDFGATYDVSLPSGEIIGSFRRKGLKSTFLRDEWLVFDASGQHLGTLAERGSVGPFIRRYVEIVAAFMPQKFDLHDASQRPVASYRQHFNWFIYRLGVAVLAEDTELDELMLLAGGCLIAAIEGRQR
ncbi:MAG: hypothetical protein ACI89L_002101 [Phycisphaerales bacterium]|jgi:hypothetical protein